MCMGRRSDCRYGACGPPTPGPSSQSSPHQRSERWICSIASGFSRCSSVSSMRSTSVPPRRRAYSQLYRAVRTPPTWRSPVGDGQKRTRGATGNSAYRLRRCESALTLGPREASRPRSTGASRSTASRSRSSRPARAPGAHRPTRPRTSSSSARGGPRPTCPSSATRSYLINLAGSDELVVERSRVALAACCDVAAELDAEAVIVHVGSHLGDGLEAGLDRIEPALGSRARRAARRPVAAAREHGRSRRHDRAHRRRARGGDRALPASAARRLPRLVPPLRVGHRRRRPRGDDRVPRHARRPRRPRAAACAAPERLADAASTRTGTGTRTSARG